MNDIIFHNPGVVDLTTVVWLQDALSGALKTGVAIADLDYRYIRVEDDNDVTIISAANVVSLSGLTDDHTDGRMYEIGNGTYRFDIPDAAVAAGASLIDLIIWDAESDTILQCPVRVQMNIAKMLKPDWYVDTTQTPWEIVYHQPGVTGNEYKRAQMKTVTGGNITSTGIPVGQHILVP